MGSHVDPVNGGWDRGWSMMGEPCNGVRDPLGASVSRPDSVTAIVVHGRAKVPAMDGMRGPRATDMGFLVDEDLNAGRGQWGAVKIKEAKNVGIGGEVGVQTAGAE